MLLIYTGNGKGKTSACVGQAMRALGQGFIVAFGQFMKRDTRAGEQIMLGKLLGPAFYAGGAGFFRKESERDAHRAAAWEVLEWAFAQLRAPLASGAKGRMLVLDEALYAHAAGLIAEEELRALIAAARAAESHLVLSGRGLPGWLEQEADLVTEMLEQKHHAASGVAAQAGIEF